jgi:peptidoglycan hydrolase-like protein with peptidoglycan-binding domain
MTVTATENRVDRWRPAPALDSARENQGMLRRNQQGESVRSVQQALASRGYSIGVDGKFGAETERAVRTFQRHQGLSADGIVGPDTLGKLMRGRTGQPVEGTAAVRREGDARAPHVDERGTSGLRAGDLAREDEARRRMAGRTPSLAPANATPEERYRHYAQIVRDAGGTLPTDRATVLGLRGLSRGQDGAQDRGSTRAYDDTFVVMRPNGTAYELRGATHPGQLRSSLSPDVNRDGVGDVGMILPGNYVARPNGDHNGAASFHVLRRDGSDRIPGVRDTNGDGIFSAAERQRSLNAGHTMGEILFHQGNADRPKSIGCLTLSPANQAELIRLVGGRNRTFDFTLVDAFR